MSNLCKTPTCPGGMNANATVTVVVHSALPSEKTKLYSNYNLKSGMTFSVTIPAGVNWILCDLSCYNYDDWSWADLQNVNNSVYWNGCEDGGDGMGGGAVTMVQVTPGKTYQLKINGDGPDSLILYYSQEINKGPDVYTEEWYYGDYVVDL